ASGTTVFAGGSVFVSSGGTTSGTEVDSGGNEVVSSGGIARGTQVTSGGTQSVAGGTTSNTHVSAGGQQIVSSGGHTSGTLIDGGGTQTVSAGGTASASQISAGGTQVVSSGGIANSTSVGSGGTSIVTSGGTASATVVSGGGTQTVNAGGITSGTIVASGGMQTVGSGGTTSSTMVASGGTQDVQSGGSASGSIIASGGTQTISNGASVTGTQVLSGGTQNLFGTVVDPIISAGGTLTIGSGTAAGSIVGNTINDGLLAFDRPDTITYAGNISGAGRIEQQGTGSVVLNGDSHLFTGTSEVMAGTLAIGDGDNPGAQLGGDVIVDAAGTLRGHGSIIGNVTNNGNVMPGGSVGTLTVGGNYTQASNASLTIEVSPTTGSQLHVGGTAALSGNLQILYDPGSYQATRYAIVTASGGVNGKFASVSNTVQSGAQLGALQQSIEYSANEVDLALSGIAQQAPGGGAPATTVIAPVDTSIYTALGTSLTLSAQMTNAALLERIARVGATSGSNMSGNDTSADAASNDATPNNGRSGTDASSRASDRSGSDASSRASVWVNATGSQTKVHSTNDEPGFEARNYGFIAGADHQVGAYTVGFSGSYNHSDISEDSTGDSGTTDALRAAVYGARMLGPVQFSAVAGAGVDFLSQKRPFGTTGTAGASTAEGDHIGQEVSTAAQAALPLAAGSVLITPRIGLRFSYLHVNGFSESGANGQDLTVGTDNVRSLQPYAQITFDKAFGNALRPVDIEWRIGYARETLGTGRTVTVGAQDGTLFAAPGTELPRDQLTTGVSVSMRPTKALAVSLGYDALIATSSASAQAATVRVDYQF
ncbi:MAG TPA: autotransporter domain-containing protein, partial [Pararobbsia sp.]|nr:autotransporter domain-containing protein [Pararobbsia sp.]